MLVACSIPQSYILWNNTWSQSQVKGEQIYVKIKNINGTDEFHIPDLPDPRTQVWYLMLQYDQY